MKGFNSRTLNAAVRATFGLLGSHLHRSGLVVSVAAVVDSITAVPEAQRPYYVEREGKFHFDPAKLPDDDIAGPGYKSAIARHEQEAKKARDELKTLADKFKDVDPEKYRQLMEQLDGDEEGKLLKEGKLQEIKDRHAEKLKADYEKKIGVEQGKTKAEQQRADKYRDQVLEKHILIAATGKMHDKALKTGDALRAAREVFDLNDDGKAVALDANGNIIMGKDGKNPFSVDDWIEEQRVDRPYLFPAQSSGGGASGDNGGGSGEKVMKRAAFEALSPPEKAKTVKTHKIVD